MPEIRISDQYCQQFVTLPASFILDHMPSMKGDYLKLYLYLVYLTQNREAFSLPATADLFECGERDLLRGLSYLKRAGLIDMETDSQGEPLSLTLLPVTATGIRGDRDDSSLTSVPSARTDSDPAEKSSSRFSRKITETPASAGPGTAGPEASERTKAVSEEGSSSREKASFEQGSRSPVLPHESHLERNEKNWTTVSSSGRSESSDPAAIRAVITGHTGSTSAVKVTPSPLPEPDSQPHLLQDPTDPEEAELVIRLVEEHLLNRPMTMREGEKTKDYYMMLNQNLDLTVFLFEYYIEKKGRDNISFAYLDKIARDWKLKGYKSDKEPRELLSREKKDQARKDYELAVRKHLGIDQILPGNVNAVDRWMYEYKIPLEALIPALDHTIERNPGNKLRYADEILKSFQQKNVRTKEEALKALRDFSDSYSAQSGAGSASPRPRRTSMHNFVERKESADSYDDLLRIPRPVDPSSNEEK